MLRIYRAPSTEPGRTTLQADAETWDLMVAELKRVREIETVREVQVALSRAGSRPVRRVTLPTATALTVLDLAERR